MKQITKKEVAKYFNLQESKLRNFPSKTFDSEKVKIEAIKYFFEVLRDLENE